MKVFIDMEQVESNCLNRLLHEVLSCASAIIPIISFCKLKIFALLEDLPSKKCSIFHKIMKVSIAN